MLKKMIKPVLEAEHAVMEALTADPNLMEGVFDQCQDLQEVCMGREMVHVVDQDRIAVLSGRPQTFCEEMDEILMAN